MSRLSVLVDPSFRSMDEIFAPATRARLAAEHELLWAADEPMPPDALREAAASADVIVFGSWRLSPDGNELGPRTRALLEVAGGHEHGLDYPLLLERGLAIGSCAPAFGPAVAEHSLALALAAMRGVVASDRGMAAGSEAWLHDGNRHNATLFGATVGFVGAGGISVHLQRLLEPFGVTVLAHDPPLPDAVMDARGLQRATVDEVLDRSDVVFVLAAPTPDNRHLLDRRRLERLASPQVLVATSRAHLIEFDAAVELASTGAFTFATDVYPEEPVPADSPVRGADGVIATPHIAGALPAALLQIGEAVAADVEAIADGRTPTAMQYLTPANAAGLVQSATPTTPAASRQSR